VPACPGDGPYPGLVFTITTLRLSPEITEPFLVTELETITVMYSGIALGGPELFPGSLVQVPPQVAGLELVEFANPLKLDGAEPPLKVFNVAH